METIDNQNVRERLKTYLRIAKVSNRLYASQLGVNENTINGKLCGKRELDISTLCHTLVLYPQLSAEWLLRGEGDMLRTQNGNNTTINVTKGDSNIVGNNGSTLQVDEPKLNDDLIKSLLEQNGRLIDVLTKTFNEHINKDS